MERCTCTCLQVFFFLVYIVVVLAVFLPSRKIWVVYILILMPLLCASIGELCKWTNKVEGNHGSNRMNQPYQMPINSVSSSIPQAPTGQSSPLHIPSTWHSSLYSPSAPTLPVRNSPHSFASNMDADAARLHAGNIQPLAYPEEVQDSTGLSFPLYTTPASYDASMNMFGPSSDGLPSYEAAMSTWQPPAGEEHPSRRDDGQRTID